MKRHSKYRDADYKSPLKPARSLDQISPGISKYPSAEYFRTRNVNDIPGRPREDYFSTRWDDQPKRKRYGKRK